MSEREKKKLLTKLQSLFNGIYKIEDNGYLIHPTFQTLPLRSGTDYYKVVQNPLSLHAVGRKLKNLKYADAQEFINDLALISWNARFYNHSKSVIYRQAQILKQYITDVVIPKLKNDKAVPNGHSLIYPHIGDLPDDRDNDELLGFSFEKGESTPGPSGASNAGSRRDEFEMSATPQADSMVALSKPLVSTGYTRLSFTTPSRPTRQKHKDNQIESGIRRGRPPIIDKPFETRIKLILKGFKKLRDNNGHPLTKHFEKLPDIKTHGDYYERIAAPISLNEIRIKVRSRKYSSVELFINDLDLMFANAQLYYENDPYSEEFLDSQQFKKEAHLVIQTELSKSDKEIILATSSSSDGVLRFPLEVLEVDGYTYKIGNWVLMKNPADPERPIVGQIFRMWSTEDGKRYVNMCWYYRPEQTCHAVDRLFFLNEVCKTGQYRDHLVDDIVGPCYVIFLTRYQKGDLPEGVIPESAPWFICEFRYNENTHVFNRIRTWKACLPDEVREDPEQPLIPLKETRKLIKYESPIKGLLAPDAYKGMDIPDAIPGTANSPPVSGSVYIGAPLPSDDLGQYISSQNVDAVPEHDETKSGRRAFLFTPISQLKGGGGSTNTVYATGPAVPHGTISHVPAKPIADIPGLTPLVARNTNILINREEKHQLPGSYKLLQEQIQENQAKKQQEQQLQQLQQQQHQQLYKKTSTPTPTSIASTGTTYHTSMSTYSNLLVGGTLAYGLNESIGELGQFVNKKRKIGNNGKQDEEILFYRAPPLKLVGNKIITNSNVELGHSATYLAWKLKQNKSN